MASVLPHLIPDISDCPELEIHKCKQISIKNDIAKYIKSKCPPTEQIIKLGSFQFNFDCIKPSIVFTTNYDSVTSLAFRNSCRILSKTDFSNHDPGVRVVHIHGHISDPNNMVFFEEDFLKFNSRFKYLYNLLYTSMIENSTVFIGYSLNDPNIKQILCNILSENKNIRCGKKIMFLRNDSGVLQVDIDNFERTYNIVVVRGQDIETFLQHISSYVTRMRDIVSNVSREESFNLVVQKNHIESIVNHREFFQDVIHLLRQRSELRTPENITFLISVLEYLKDLSGYSQAWSKYTDLARYLTIVGIDIPVTDLGLEFQEAWIEHYQYLCDCSGKRFGQAYDAADLIQDEFSSMLDSNKELLKADPQINERLKYLGIQ